MADVLRSFIEPDQFAAAIRPAQAQITATRRGAFGARLSLVDLDRVGLRIFEADVPLISHSALAPGATVLSFLMEPTEGMYLGGGEFNRGMLIRHGIGRDYYLRSTGPATLANLLLPNALIDRICGNSDGPPQTPRDTQTITPSEQAMSRLRRLHVAATRLAQDAPEILSHAGAVRGLEQALIEAVFDCLAGAEPRRLSFARRRQEDIMRHLYRLLEEHRGEGVFVSEICDELRISPRSFRMYCLEHLGMGPKRFLLLRRMQLVRRRLLEADVNQTAVTQIATEYCFWELGRFAVVYKQLFGESPSDTLRRPPATAHYPDMTTMRHRRPAAK
jgi:AraC-like DNA-binding protein